MKKHNYIINNLKGKKTYESSSFYHFYYSVSAFPWHCFYTEYSSLYSLQYICLLLYSLLYVGKKRWWPLTIKKEKKKRLPSLFLEKKSITSRLFWCTRTFVNFIHRRNFNGFNWIRMQVSKYKGNIMMIKCTIYQILC